MSIIAKLRNLSPSKKSPSPPSSHNSFPSTSRTSKPNSIHNLPSLLAHFFNEVQALTITHRRTKSSSSTSTFTFHSPISAQSDASILCFAYTLPAPQTRQSLTNWNPLTDIGGRYTGSVTMKVKLVVKGIELAVKEGQMRLRDEKKTESREKEVKKMMREGDEVVRVLEEVRGVLLARCRLALEKESWFERRGKEGSEGRAKMMQVC